METDSRTQCVPAWWRSFWTSRHSEGGRLVGDIVFLCLFLGAVPLWGEQPWIMLGVVAAILATRAVVIGVRGDWIFFAMGLVLGGGNDLGSMIKGVYTYNVPHPLVPWPIPLWMFPFWGQAFLVMRSLFSYGPFKGPGADRPLWPPGWPLLLDLAGLVVMKALFYRFYEVRYVPETLALAVLIVVYAAHGITRTDVRIMLTTLIVAPLVEGALIASGIYDYTNGTILGMPAWLLVFWLYVTPLLKRIYDHMDYAAAHRAGLNERSALP